MPLSRHMVTRLTRLEQCHASSRPVDHRPIWEQDPEAYRAQCEQGMIASAGSVEAYLDAMLRAGAEAGQGGFEVVCRALGLSEADMDALWETHKDAAPAGGRCTRRVWDSPVLHVDY